MEEDGFNRFLQSIPDYDEAPFMWGNPPDEKQEEMGSEEKLSLDHAAKKEEIAKSKMLREQEEADRLSARGMRECYAGRAYWYLAAYSLACLLLLVFDGFHFWGFSLSDSILLALVGSTAVSIIGLVGIVLTGLFPKRD